MRPWIVLQHVSWEGPGAIAGEARARRIPLEIHRMDLDARIPEPDDLSGLIVMGGPMGVYETDRYSFIEGECGLIAEVVRRGLPVLGVCLGAQLLASALGGRVYRGPAAEIGFGNVELTEDARQDPVFKALPATLPAFHWHGDTFDLPEGAVLLAKNATYAHQAFRFGRNAYGLQFHNEVDRETWLGWTPLLPGSAVAGAEPQRAEVECAGNGLFARFFEIAQEVDYIKADSR